MKALTLYPEWAWAITHLDKRVENRSWMAPSWLEGERFAIHAGASTRAYDKAGWLFDLREAAEDAGWSSHFVDGETEFNKGAAYAKLNLAHSAIVAVVRVRKCTPDLPLPPWGQIGNFHWYLEDVQVLPTPLRCAGQQGLWNVPEELVLGIEKQIGGVK
jgi:hypothetical protein